jgi:hypothetical protein
MVQSIVLAVFGKVFEGGYKLVDDYVISNFLAFVRSIEFALVVILAMSFLILTVGIMLRRAKRLPKYYNIEITDLDGRYDSPDGLRQAFSTFDAAESYARFYQQMYGHQYRFKVVGSNKSFEKTTTVGTNNAENRHELGQPAGF